MVSTSKKATTPELKDEERAKRIDGNILVCSIKMHHSLMNMFNKHMQIFVLYSVFHRPARERWVSRARLFVLTITANSIFVGVCVVFAANNSLLFPSFENSGLL